jgi:hypothetical protein
MTLVLDFNLTIFRLRVFFTCLFYYKQTINQSNFDEILRKCFTQKLNFRSDLTYAVLSLLTLFQSEFYSSLESRIKGLINPKML